MTGEQLDLVSACAEADAEALLAPSVKVRHDAPVTSQLAAAKALGRSSSARFRVLADLDVNGPATDDELAHACGLLPNTERPRRVELVELGFVEASGQTRDSAGGSPATVWQATPAGRRALAAARSS